MMIMMMMMMMMMFASITFTGNNELDTKSQIAHDMANKCDLQVLIVLQSTWG